MSITMLPAFWETKRLTIRDADLEEASRARTRSNYRRFATGRKNSLDTFTFDMGFRSQKSFGCPWQ